MYVMQIELWDSYLIWNTELYESLIRNIIPIFLDKLSLWSASLHGMEQNYPYMPRANCPFKKLIPKRRPNHPKIYTKKS